MAFYHTKPFWEKHIVIIPKKHIKDLICVSDEDMQIITQIMHVARDLAKDLDLSEGVKLLTNLGKFQVGGKRTKTLQTLKSILKNGHRIS